MTELSVEDLHFSYGSVAVLKGVSLVLQRGEVVSLLGPSGSGKTALLRSIAGLETPSAGAIRIGNRLVFSSADRLEIPAEHRDLGLVFQSYALWPHRTVFENVAYPLRLRRTPAQELRDRVERVMTELGMAHLGQRYPHQLSGGQQQRVAIARVLAHNPQILLLDEPLSNLDAKLRDEARAYLRELIVRLQLSAIIVTHDQREAMGISDRVLLLNEGKFEQEGSPEDLYAAPKTLFCAEFMGSNNLLTGSVSAVDGEFVWVEGNGFRIRARAVAELQPGQPTRVVARVEQAIVTDQPGENRLEMMLTTSMFQGERWEHLFRPPSNANGSATAPLRACSPSRRPPGRYWLEFPPDRAWAFSMPIGESVSEAAAS